MTKDPIKENAELRRLENAISHFLRWGVLVAGILLATGWVMELMSSGSHLLSFQTYQDEPLMTLLAKARATGDHSKLVQSAGLAALVSLPIIRVLLTALLFLKQRERLMASAAFFVFAVLIGSFFLGIEL